MRQGIQHGYIRRAHLSESMTRPMQHIPKDERQFAFTAGNVEVPDTQLFILRNVSFCKNIYDLLSKCDNGASQVDICIRWIRSQGLYSEIIDRCSLREALRKMTAKYPEPDYTMSDETRRVLVHSFENQGGALGENLAEVVYHSSLLGIKEIVFMSTKFLSTLGASEVCSSEELMKFAMADCIVGLTDNSLLVGQEIEFRAEEFTFHELDVIFKSFARLTFVHPGAVAAVVKRCENEFDTTSEYSLIASICESLCIISKSVPGVVPLTCRLARLLQPSLSKLPDKGLTLSKRVQSMLPRKAELVSDADLATIQSFSQKTDG